MKMQTKIKYILNNKFQNPGQLLLKLICSSYIELYHNHRDHYFDDSHTELCLNYQTHLYKTL